MNTIADLCIYLAWRSPPDGSRAGSGHIYRVVDLRDGARGAPHARLADAIERAEALRTALGEERR